MRSGLALLAVVFSLVATGGYAQAPASAAGQAPSTYGSGTGPNGQVPKSVGRDMLNAVLQPVQQQLGAGLQAGVQAGIGVLFNRLFSALGAPGASMPNPAVAVTTPTGTNPYGQPAGDPNAAAQQGTPAYGQPAAVPAPAPPPSPSDPNAGAQPPAPASAPAPSGPQPPAPPPPAAPSIVPSVVYALDQVDPTTFATIAAIDLSHGPPVLHTGDVFAIRYSTNVPGQVRIDNVDSAGATNSLGTYTVVPGRDNRIPLTKGIQLTGVTGLEQFKMYFYPCAADSGGSPAAAGLPPCTSAANPKLAMASKRLVVAKSAVNLDSPDPTIAVAAATNYRPNDVTENDFALQHMPRQ